MSHRNEGRDEHRSSMRHNRQEVPHTTTTHRTHPISPSSKHTMDRYSLPISFVGSGGYGKCLD